MRDTKNPGKQDHRYAVASKRMTSIKIAPEKLKFSIDLKKMELQMKGSNTTIKYYEGLG